MTQTRRPEQHFEATSTRLVHIQRVVSNAEIVESRESFGDRLILAAAYHDIGYAPDLAVTRFHPVDSALIATADGLPPGRSRQSCIIRAPMAKHRAHGRTCLATIRPAAR